MYSFRCCCESIADVVGGLRPFKRIGFVIMVTCRLIGYYEPDEGKAPQTAANR